jgi:hypothetical protein
MCDNNNASDDMPPEWRSAMQQTQAKFAPIESLLLSVRQYKSTHAVDDDDPWVRQKLTKDHRPYFQLKNEIEENPPPFQLAHQEGHHRIMMSIMMSNVRPIENLLQRVADYDAIWHGIGNDDPWVQQQLVEANRLYMEFIEVWGLAWVPEDLQAKMEIMKRGLY